MEWLNVLLIIGFILFVLYTYGMRKSKYWEKKGVKQTKQWLPFIGDSYPNLFGKMDPLEHLKQLYNTFKDERFGGIYILNTPMLMVRDSDLLKQITIKDAEYFLNRYDWSSDSDPFLNKNLSVLKGEKWRNMRIVMTTVFTASKMKDMFIFMEKCSEQSAEFMATKLKAQIQKEGSDADVLAIELKDYFSRYGTDVIASTAFGIESDSFNNPNNEFFKAGQIMTAGFSSSFSLKLFFLMIFPSLSRMLKITFFGPELSAFFNSVVGETIRHREKNNVIRKDVIHALMEARKEKEDGETDQFIKGKLLDIDDEDIAAQAVLFYFGGFETMASLMGFFCYEIALNPEIQDKLHEEIDRVIENENGVTYNGVLNQMRYLDMVVSETLRKYPPAAVTDRTVTKPYTIPKTESSPEVKLEAGDAIFIPIAALHHDPNNFPNPEKFDPERFRSENDFVKPFTYMPFGAGLRHCIAMRYALMEAKIGLVHFLRKFDIVPIKKTEIPLQLCKNGSFLLRPNNGIWLGLKIRN